MFGVALLTSALLAVADARIYERCELARELLNLGVRREHIATWVCIAYHESRFDTAARNPYSGDHGLLQISELYWCGAGKACGLPCSALRDDDISDDVECALRVHEEHTRLQGNGFLAWVVYPLHCRHNAKKYLADCGSSVKTSSVRTDGRARVLKSQNRVATNDTYNSKIDELLPPYLLVSSLLRGNYEKQFEENYNKNERFNWLDYKIDNIDDLKLPVFNQKVRGGKAFATTPTLAPTRTTTESTLPNIKPPSPRRIESNSFRRRMMRPHNEADKSNETTDYSKVIAKHLSNTIAPIIHRSTTESYTRQNSLATFGIPLERRTFPTTTTTTTTKKPPTEAVELSLPFTSATSKTNLQTTKSPFLYTSSIVQATLQTTRLPTIYTSNTATTTLKTTKLPMPFTSKMAQRTAAQGINTTSTYRTTTRRTYTATERPVPGVYSTTPAIHQRTTIKPLNSRLLIDKKLSTSIGNFKTNVSDNISSVPRLIGTQILSPSNTSVIKNGSGNKERSTLPPPSFSQPRSSYRTTWKTSAEQKTTSTTTTSRHSTRNWRTAKSWSSPLAEKLSKNISTTTQGYEPTVFTPRSKNQTWLEPKLLSRQLPGSNNITIAPSTRNHWLQATTPIPRVTWPTAKSWSKPTPVATSSTSTTHVMTSTAQSTTSSPTTARTTQSIFDLYLNPTKPPKLPAFSIQPFKSNGFRLRIFAGGTTTHSPSFVTNKDPKVLSRQA